MTVNMQDVEKFAFQVVADAAAAFSSVMTLLGQELGLYKAMAGEGWMTTRELAEKTGLTERYVREWLSNQVAGGYLHYDPEGSRFQLPDAHVPVLADEDSPVFLVPALKVAGTLWHDQEKIADAFRTGKGIAWGDHHHSLFCGCESMFKPGYRAHLATDWIGALEGVADKLRHGGKIADIGCGHGASTIVMAQAFPNSQVFGFDSHDESIDIARARAAEAGVDANCTFEARAAKTIGEEEFDLVCFMDCLHDMGDPVGAARQAYRALKPEGTILLVEPAAEDRLEDNINPVSRMYYAASTGLCTPCSMSQEVKTALGAQAGPARLATVLAEAGFAQMRVAAKTPFNLILEARK